MDLPGAFDLDRQNNEAECSQQSHGHQRGVARSHVVAWLILLILLVLAAAIAEWTFHENMWMRGQVTVVRLRRHQTVTLIFDGLQFALCIWICMALILSRIRWRLAYAAVGAIGINISIFLASRAWFITRLWDLHLLSMLIPAATVLLCLRNAGYQITTERGFENRAKPARPRIRFAITDLFIVTSGFAAFLWVSSTLRGFYGPWYYELMVSVMGLVVFLAGLSFWTLRRRSVFIAVWTCAFATVCYFLGVPIGPWFGFAELLATSIWACLIVITLRTCGYGLIRVN